MPWLSLVPWKLVGFFAVAIALTGLVHSCQHYRDRAASLEVQLDRSIEVSNANAEAAKKYAAEVERIGTITVRAAEVKNDIKQRAEQRRAEIMSTPSDQDGPLAPVLRDQLNRLPVATYSDGNRPDVTAAGIGGTAFADAGAVPPGAARDTEGRGGRH